MSFYIQIKSRMQVSRTISTLAPEERSLSCGPHSFMWTRQWSYQPGIHFGKSVCRSPVKFIVMGLWAREVP